MFDVIQVDLQDVTLSLSSATPLEGDANLLTGAEINSSVLERADIASGLSERDPEPDPGTSEGPDIDGDGDRDWFDERHEEIDSLAEETFLRDELYDANDDWERGERLNDMWDDFVSAFEEWWDDTFSGNDNDDDDAEPDNGD